MDIRIKNRVKKTSQSIIACFFLAFSAALWAQDADSANTLYLERSSQHISTASALYYIEDPLNQWSLSYLLNHDIRLSPYPKAVFNEGFTASAYWLKFSVDGSQSRKREWLMEINYPLLDVVDIYILDGDQNLIRHKKMGDLLPFEQRDFSHRNFILPLDFHEHSFQTIYINVHSASSMQVPINLWEVNHFTEERSNEQYGLGLYYGMMLVMFLYNLFLWTSIRDNNYLHYITYIAAFAGIQLATSGLGYQFIWTASPWFQQIAVPLTIGLVGIFGTTFTRGFLQTRLHHRPADIALRLCLMLSAAICISSFLFPISTVMSIGKFVVVIFLTTVFYASFVMLIKGQRLARYFLAAWVALIIGGMITIGMMLGLLPNNMWTIHASKIGSGLEIVLLSFALADRIKLLQKAKLDAEARVKKELEYRAERLAESNRLKNDFLATISHEFRTPLNGIIGSLELADDEKGHTLMANLQDARDSARDMLDLVDNVLTYTELQAGNRILAPETMDLNTLIQTTSDYSRQLCQEKNLTFDLHLDAALPDCIRADVKCIRHAFKALLENAVKFTDHGGIHVSVSMDVVNQMPCLKIIIKDTGVGMTHNELVRIQNSFGQADSSMQRQYQGLGIGLSLVRAVCHVMQGDISIDSSKHQGTRVTLRIPVQPLGRSELTDVSNMSRQQSMTPIENIRGRALIVEDNTVNQRVLSSMLNRLHIETDVADNGEKALALLLDDNRQYHYDLIFMDCQMPVMDGFEATDKIRSGSFAESDCPIIAVTANAMSGDEQRCLNAGMNDYLSKPVSMAGIKTVVYRWLHTTDVREEPPPAVSDPQSMSPAHKPS